MCMQLSGINVNALHNEYSTLLVCKSVLIYVCVVHNNGVMSGIEVTTHDDY